MIKLNDEIKLSQPDELSPSEMALNVWHSSGVKAIGWIGYICIDHVGPAHYRFYFYRNMPKARRFDDIFSTGMLRQIELN